MANSFEASNCGGVWTALVTPFDRGEVDYKSLKNLVKFQLDSGVSGFVVSGTTGESPTLTKDEKEKILKFVLSEVSGAVPIMFGGGTNSTNESVLLSKAAQKWGADALLTVVPYYNKPTQSGLKAHFTALAQSVDLPVMLYNVPTRTITALSEATILDLSMVSGIFGIKEASGDIDFLGRIVSQSLKDFRIFSGDDGTCISAAKAGAHGVISVLSHLIPHALVTMFDDARRGKDSNLEFFKYSKITDLLFKVSNPIPVKFALFKMGIIGSPELRLPLESHRGLEAEECLSEIKRLGLVE